VNGPDRTRDEDIAPEGTAGEIGRAAERRLKARRERRHGVWFGLGMFGLVGWSVAIPVLAGIALGWWLDHAVPQRFSWTLALLLAGTVLGAMNAWFWVEKESRDE
jgi:ATP synthase protein I